MTRAHLAVLAIVVVLAAAVWWMVPSGRQPLVAAPDPLTVRGAIHVHTRRSDGTGTVEDVARAAARAGLDFVAITDHGDATQFMDAPRYIDGVLVIDGVEISTTAGHYIALGMAAFRASTRRARVTAWLAAQVVFFYIVAVAVTKSPSLGMV